MNVASEVSPRRGGISPIVVAGILIIAMTTLFQGLGFCWGLERNLMRMLPSSIAPQAPRVALLQLEKGSSGEFSEMDAALALRGLEQLHPRSVTILGTVRREEGAMDFLPAMLARLKESKGHFPVMIPVIPSSEAHYAPLPWLLSGNPPFSWPTLAGREDNESVGSFLTEADSAAGIPLFARTETGGVGSLWWRTLLETIPPAAQARLLFGKVLLLGNHAAVMINSLGRCDADGVPCVRTAMDEFLLRIEQRERGIISPGFDGIWSGAFVVIGTPDDLPKSMVFQSLLERLSMARLVPWTQAVIAALCIATLLLLSKATLPAKLLAAALIVISAGTASFLLISHCLLFPWLPCVMSALFLLLIPSRRG